MLIFSVFHLIPSFSGIADRGFRAASIINKERMWLKIFLLIFLFCTFVANYGNVGFFARNNAQVKKIFSLASLLRPFYISPYEEGKNFFREGIIFFEERKNNY